MRGSTYMRIFSQYSQPPISSGFVSTNSTNPRLKIIFLILGSESPDAKGLLCAFHTIFYKGLEHLRQFGGRALVWWSNELYRWIFKCTGLVPLTPMMFKRQLYSMSKILSDRAF